MGGAPADDSVDRDGARRAIEKLVGQYYKGTITSDELCAFAWQSLGRLPVEARVAGLGPLVAGVGDVAHTILTLCRNEALSRDPGTAAGNRVEARARQRSGRAAAAESAGNPRRVVI